MSRVRYRRGGSQSRFGVFLSLLAVLLLMLAVSAKGITLTAMKNKMQERIDALEAQIAEQEARSEEIAEYEKYTKTRGYIEEIAKSRLGLVYPGEIIFKAEE